MEATPLTTADRLDIIELPARYADALDQLQPDRLDSVFTDDAVWEVVGRDMRLTGLGEIKEFMGRPGVHPGAHLMTNIYIADVGVDERDPTGRSLLVRLSSRGVFPVGPSDPKQPTAVFYGRYDDDIVRTDAGWRIRHRRYTYGS